jgi:AcrR family transcriptional regulator
MKSGTDNRQVKRSRAAFLEAFNELVLTRRYDDIRVGDIIRLANVGRSTFYEHFRGKDDLLRQSMSHILSVFADAVSDSCEMPKLEWVLEHFRENMTPARGLVNGPSCPQIVGLLASLIEERLGASLTQSSKPGMLPLNFLAAQVAEAQFGLIRTWLNGGALYPAAQVAEAIHGGSVALAGAWLGKLRQKSRV